MENREKMPPIWINIEFLQKVMRNYKDDTTIRVINFKVQSGSDEHFASNMFKCRIDFESVNPKCVQETLNVLIKSKPDEGLKMEMCSGPLFENEIEMYRKILPAIHNLFERSGLKIDLEPEMIYETNEPFPIIILKDLTFDGFSAPRLPPVELADSKLLIQRLAQFHAASYYLTETKELNLTNFNYSVYETDSLIKMFYGDSVKAFREVLETWEGYQHYIPKLDYLWNNIGEIGRKCYAVNGTRAEGYNVLNHGDFHTRNTLLKRDSENRLENFYFIDYQVSVFTSPAIDLYFMGSQVKEDEEGEIPFEDLVVFYHQEFVDTLKRFGFLQIVPSLLDLNVELLRHGQISVLMMIVFAPFRFIDWENMRIDDMLATNDDDNAKKFKKSLYNHPICKKLIQKELQTFVHKGWL